jgi:predicted component of type VI protein secretion system
VENDRLFLRDTSTNGTLVDGEPVVRDTTVELRSRQSLHLGSLIIVVDKPSQGEPSAPPRPFTPASRSAAHRFQTDGSTAPRRRSPIVTAR